jgi:predicted TPR repeat methyltransferase
VEPEESGLSVGERKRKGERVRHRAGRLAPGGIAAFSIEAGADAPFALGPGLRYRHDPAHVAALAEAAGLVSLAREETVLREEKGAPVPGVIFVLSARQ